MPSYAHTKITLFDLTTGLPGGRAVSPYCARVRYILNYKGLGYKTNWVDLRYLEEISAEHGFKPTGKKPDGSDRWTLPAITDETSGATIAITDSFPIIQYLEKTYPDPERPIFPSISPNTREPFPAIHAIVNAYLGQCVIVNTRRLVLPKMWWIQKEECRASWIIRATQIFDRKITLEDITIEVGSKEYKEMWAKMKEVWTTLAGFLDYNPDSVWILGDKPTFADFAILSALMWMRFSDPEGVWAEVKGLAGGKFERFAKAGEEYITLK